MSFRMAEAENVAVVKVFGVGGGGGNAVNTMVSNKLQGVQFIVANTDKQALDQSRADLRLQIGPATTRGLGAGADPDTGNLSAMESLEEIREALKGSDMVFVTCGLGGGTGTGAAPVVARASKELGILTVAVVTKPFGFEGKCRARNAERGWEELQKHVDTIITIPNDRLLSLMEKESKLSDMLTMADSVLSQAVKGITDLINVPGLINADFADLKAVMKEVGPAIMGSAAASGENRATEAARLAIDNQLLEECGIDGARGLLVNISASQESFTMNEFMEASALIQEKVDDEANVVIGALYDEALGDALHVTVIATGVGGKRGSGGTVDPVRDRMGRTRSAAYSGRDAEVSGKGVAAQPNRNRGTAQLPGSIFDSMDNVAVSEGSDDSQSAASSMNRNDDYLETPAFLRKKSR